MFAQESDKWHIERTCDALEAFARAVTNNDNDDSENENSDKDDAGEEQGSQTGADHAGDHDDAEYEWVPKEFVSKLLKQTISPPSRLNLAAISQAVHW